MAEECRQRLRRDVDRGRGAVRKDLVGEPGQDARPGRSADDDQPASECEPAAERCDLASRQGVGVDVLPDEAIEGRPGFDPLGQVTGIERNDDGPEVQSAVEVLSHRELDPRDDSLGLRGNDADGQLGRVVNREVDLPAGDDLVIGADEDDFQLLPEGRRLRIQEVGLVRGARQIDRDGEPGAALRSSLQAQLASDRDALVGKSHLDCEPRTDPGVALEENPRIQRGAVRGGNRYGSRPGHRPDEDAEKRHAGNERSG